MLNKFSSHIRKLNRVISKINVNNLNDDLYLTASLLNTELPTSRSFQSHIRKNPYLPKVVNQNNLNDSLFVTASLQNIELPSSRSFDSTTKSNPNTISIVNNKNTINDFHSEILEYSARSITKVVDLLENIGFGKLTIYNTKLAYGTISAKSEDFEIFIGGLQLPGNYTINEVGNDIVIEIGEDLIDLENTLASDIYVIGKLVNIQITTEEFGDLITEDDNFDIIL